MSSLEGDSQAESPKKLRTLREQTGALGSEGGKRTPGLSARAALDALSAHIAILDERGKILAVNQAWRNFAQSNAPSFTGLLEGANYLDVCDIAAGPDSAEATEFAAGLRAVLHGERDEFVMEYPCNSPEEDRWFMGRVTRFTEGGHTYAVVAHENITERRRMEQVLRISEERYRTVVEDQTELISRILMDGTILFANEAYCRFWGKSAIDLIGNKWHPLAVPEDLSHIEHQLTLLSPSHPVVEVENRVHGADGQIHWMHFINRGLFDRSGRLTEIQSVGRDITERKYAEAIKAARLHLLEFAVTHSLHELLVETLDQVEILTDSKIGFYHFVEEDQITLSLQAWSTATARDYCTAQGEGLHYPVNDAGVWADCVRERRPIVHNDYASLTGKKGLPPGHAAVVRELTVPVFRGGRIVAVLGVGNRSSDYTERDVELVARLADLAWDIAEHRRVEEALHVSEVQLLESTQILESILDNTHILASLLDPQFNIVWVNRAFAAADRKDPSFYKGKNHFSLYPSEANRAIFQRVVDTGVSHFVENDAFVYPDQSERGVTYWDWSLVPVRNVDKAVSGLVLTLVEVTARVRAEEARLQLETQMQHAQKLESLGILAGGIAHDFNNLLAAILGNADLVLQDEAATPVIRENVRGIVDASRRAAALTQQMLAYSGRGRFVSEPMDLNETVRTLADLLKASISKKTTLTLNLAPHLPSIQADAAQMQQLVMNLLLNAAESLGPERGGNITVTTTLRHCSKEELARTCLLEQAAEGVYLCLEVVDTGCGMDTGTLDRLFEPFFTTKFTGRGLGMAAVLGIARAHDAAIAVESVPGAGTTVRVYLQPVPSTSAARTSARPAAPAPASGTVLFVDDEPSVRDVGERILRRLGYDVLLACDGIEALEVFEKHQDRIVCVVLDLSMPRMDGEETFHRLRALNPECPVVLASGYPEAEIETRLGPLHATAFMQKPFDIKTLALNIERLRAL